MLFVSGSSLLAWLPGISLCKKPSHQNCAVCYESRERNSKTFLHPYIWAWSPDPYERDRKLRLSAILPVLLIGSALPLRSCTKAFP